MDDIEIIELFFERSEQAIVELQKKYGAVCLKVAENILNNRPDSEECVNDALLGVWDSIPPCRPDSLLGYLIGIVRKVCVKRYRANTAQKRGGVYDAALDEVIDCFPSSFSVEDEYDAAEAARAIDAFLETLDARERILFVRRYWHSDPISDLASLFGVSEHMVSVRLFRTRKKLKNYLNKKGVLW